MARKPEEQKRIDEIIRQAEAARRQLVGQAQHLRERIDIPARLRNSLGGHPGRWMAGSLFSGLAASLLLRRKPARAVKSSGTLVAILGMLFTAARPLLKFWLAALAKRLASRAQERFLAPRHSVRP